MVNLNEMLYMVTCPHLIGTGTSSLLHAKLKEVYQILLSIYQEAPVNVLVLTRLALLNLQLRSSAIAKLKGEHARKMLRSSTRPKKKGRKQRKL